VWNSHLASVWENKINLLKLMVKVMESPINSFNSPLANLYTQFRKTVSISRHYLGPAQANPNVLQYTDQKTVPLAQVFKIASQQIEDSLKRIIPTPREIFYLRSLKESGYEIYERYAKKTNSWSRCFFKALARYTPELLKRFLPSCFSNQMEKAEAETKVQHGKYQNLIKTILLKHPKSKSAKDQYKKEEIIQDLEKGRELKSLWLSDDEEGDIESQSAIENDAKLSRIQGKQAPLPQGDDPFRDSLPPLPLPSKEEIEDKRKKAIAVNLEKLSDAFLALNEFTSRPLSMQRYKYIFGKAFASVEALVKLGSEEEIQRVLKEFNIDKSVGEVLKDPRFKIALNVNDPQSMLTLLESSPWRASLAEAIAQKGFISFGIRKVIGHLSWMLANELQERVRDQDMENYRGEIQLTVIEATLPSIVEQLLDFLDKSPSCQPSTVVIQLTQDRSLPPELFQLIMKLSQRVSQIKLEGLEEINLGQITTSEAEREAFLLNLEAFDFPQINKIVLSDDPKNHWKGKDFSRLLALCPSIAFLKECYEQCSSYQEIEIPPLLTSLKELDLRGYSIDQVSHLLPQFPSLTHLNLSGLSITDKQLQEWIGQNVLVNLNVLHLEGCNALTIDILPLLSRHLPQLARLSLPDLPQGQLPLDKLPKFENPFKIKLFYASCKTTQPLASHLYTGPQIWASLFQIPLARQGVAQIFPSHHKRLDPLSVACWLHANDYQHLRPQNGIGTIVADCNAALNDDNLIAFVQKFPRAKTISLYHCPNITDQGIVNLLKAFPDIKTLDLTGCRHVTADLFLADGSLDVVKKLKRLILTDTAISFDIISAFRDQMKPTKLDYQEITLTISNDDLTDDEALERILQSKKNLTTLKRIDLEGCTKLTDAMLGPLLDRLNAHALIQGKEGWIENPQRLNLAILNLKGCFQITDKAFDQACVVGKKIEPRLLETLDQLVVGETQISPLLKDIYPQTTFQESETPITLEIDPDRQLEACMAYHQIKALGPQESEESKGFKPLATRYIHNRIVVELFCEDQEARTAVLEQPVKSHSKEFSDLTLSFKVDDDADPVVFQTHAYLLYTQSRYFLDGLRAGGQMSKNRGLDFVNKHATPEAARVVMKLFHGDASIIENLDWQTAADAAELVGSHNFKLGDSYYKAFLKRIHSQFELSRAEEMLVVVNLLEDHEGKKEYEETLICLLATLEENDEEHFLRIRNLAKSFALSKLQANVDQIEKKKTKQLVEQNLKEQEIENRRLSEATAGFLQENEGFDGLMYGNSFHSHNLR